MCNARAAVRSKDDEIESRGRRAAGGGRGGRGPRARARSRVAYIDVDRESPSCDAEQQNAYHVRLVQQHDESSPGELE